MKKNVTGLEPNISGLGREPQWQQCNSYDTQFRHNLRHQQFRQKKFYNNGPRLPRLAVTVNEDLNENVLPVCLSWNDTIKLPTRYNVVMGWGRTNNDDLDSGNQTTSGAFSSILQVPTYNTYCQPSTYKGSTIVNYSTRVVKWGIFKSGVTLEL